jgi:hypothetical protein
MADLTRWGNVASYLPEWVGRAQIVGSYLSGCLSVLDVGAGTQTLKRFVRGRYIPVDCVKLTPDVITLDLDSDWTATDLPASDGVAMVGVLEHTKNPVSVIAKMAPIGSVWAVSYMDSKRHKNHKLISLGELEIEFARAGFDVEQSKMWNGQKVYRLVR